MIRYIKF